MAESSNTHSVRDVAKALTTSAERAENAELPTSGEFHYYKNFPQFKQVLASTATLLKDLLAKSEVFGSRTLGVSSGTAAQALAGDDEDIADWASGLLDDLYERVDRALDDQARVLKAVKEGVPLTAAGANSVDLDTMGASIATNSVPGSSPEVIRHVYGLPKPQLMFEDSVDNTHRPFVPKTQHLQGHASSAPPARGDRLAAYAQSLGVVQGEEGDPGYMHPFALELEGLRYEAWQVAADDPTPPRPLEETPLVFVDDMPALQAMVDALSASRHIALDLEHHSYRSYHGFTCLMQISTRTTDYIVDTLALRSALGPALSRLLSDPSVVKVLHGADSDIHWLQKDFGLYVVNLFDTGQAARVLEQPASLAHLLSHFCGVVADKRYQLADWRMRPLPEDMLAYARTDTHYLLYVYDRLKQELALKGEAVPASLQVPLPADGPQGALGLVLERSRQLSLQLYVKQGFSDEDYIESLVRWQLTLSAEQRAVFAALFAWRDRVAREEDESLGFVLPKALLISLAKEMPASLTKLRAALGRAPSEIILRRSSELLSIISEARSQADALPDPNRWGLLPAAAGGTAAAAAAGGTIPAAAAGLPSAAPVTAKAVKAITMRGGGALGGIFGGTRAAAASPSPPASSTAAVAATAPPSPPAGSTAAAAAASEAPVAAVVQPPVVRPSGMMAGMMGAAAPAQSPTAAAIGFATTLPAMSPGVKPVAVRVGAGLGGMLGAAKRQAVAAPSLAATGTSVVSQPAAASSGQAGVSAAPDPDRNPIEGHEGAEGMETEEQASQRHPAGVASTSGSGMLGVLGGKRPAEGSGHSHEAVKKLKASFVLPWVAAAAAAAPGFDTEDGPAAVAAAGGGTPAAAAGQMAEVEEAEEPRRTTGADVRAVIDELFGSGEGAGEGTRAADAMEVGPGSTRQGEEEEDLDDFLPLPISEVEKEPRKRRWTAGQDEDTPAAGGRGGRAGGSSEEAARGRGGRSQGRGGRAPQEVAPVDFEVLRRERDPSYRPEGGDDAGGRGGRGARGRRGGARGDAGRGRRGRGGRTPLPRLPGGRDGGHSAGFQPFDIPDEHLIKGGKRSTAFPRSGNRSMTFSS